MGNTIALIFLLILLYILISGFIVAGMCYDKKLHIFDKPEYEDNMFPDLKTTDDKFIFFTYWLIWPFMLCIRYIPKALYLLGKFIVNYFAWSIAKIFKL